MHTCIICIGSNCDRENKVTFARMRLKSMFPSIQFAEEKETKPIGLDNPALFTNQLAIFATEISQEEVKSRLKSIEIEAGRQPEDKKKEIIVLDIDLVKYDDLWLKELIPDLLTSSLFNSKI